VKLHDSKNVGHASNLINGGDALSPIVPQVFQVTVSLIDMKRVLEILPSRSCGLQWRASPWFITLGITQYFICALLDAEKLCLHISCRHGYGFGNALSKFPLNRLPSGITTDFLIYSIIIPVIPFHLQALGYSDVSSLVGYLLFAYVSPCRILVYPLP
jgi:hypothetical protein